MEEERLYDLYALDEDIKILENWIKKDNYLFVEVGDGAYFSKIEKNAVEHLIEAYRKVKEENEILRNKQTKVIADSFHEKMAKKFDEDFILKSKVKEKIDSKFKEAKGLYERGVQPQAQFTMKLLRDLEKELLEEE